MNDVVEYIAQVKVIDVFNPYSEVCPIYDYEYSPALRKGLISQIFEKSKSVDVNCLWLGRDLGYNGGRRTGLAFTDDVHVVNHLSRWGIDYPGDIVRNFGVKERTATTIWGVLNSIDVNVFMWNVFPFHPHKKNEIFTNRAHSAKERAIGEEILRQVIEMSRPDKIYAIGNDAFKSASRCANNERVYKVRHPSYGGINIFKNQMAGYFS